MEGRCQCGQIRFTTPTPSPQVLYICHCTECRRQSSSLFGLTAIFPAFDIPEPSPGAIGTWRRPTGSGATMECFFCTRCGSRLMHRVRGGATCSVKGGCLGTTDAVGKKLDWGRATQIWLKSKVFDVHIPEGVEAYDEEPPDGSFATSE